MTRPALCLALLFAGGCAAPADLPDAAAIDARVRTAMAETRANGMAIAVIDDGRVAYVQAYGTRNANGDPLRTDTVMYGASITKTVMAYTTLTPVDRGRIDSDTPLADYLERPLISYGEGEAYLAKYGPYRDLAGDDRWRTITARMALTHSTGFHNFWFIEPDQRLRIHFDPGSRYSYSGEGFSLLQFAIEQGDRARGLGLDVKALTDAIFARLDMTAELVKPSLHIGTAHQFPNFAPELPKAEQRPDLAAGLGVIVFEGPQGRGFYKGGHDAQTANSFVCVERNRRCVLLLANDVRAEARFADLVRFILGDTGVPYEWEYGDRAGIS
ncbi:MAG TPA: serine hydrolase domain-containing protein [Vicinamibacterales bacterium]|nr:serine hydrolase domain-containing protein [Vicinamibacterales bacterium]